MHAIIVKQSFAVVVAFVTTFVYSETPATMILLVVGCEDCVRENKLPLWGLGAKPSDAGQFFGKK